MATWKDDDVDGLTSDISHHFHDDNNNDGNIDKKMYSSGFNGEIEEINKINNNNNTSANKNNNNINNNNNEYTNNKNCGKKPLEADDNPQLTRLKDKQTTKIMNNQRLFEVFSGDYVGCGFEVINNTNVDVNDRNYINAKNNNNTANNKNNNAKNNNNNRKNKEKINDKNIWEKTLDEKLKKKEEIKRLGDESVTNVQKMTSADEGGPSEVPKNGELKQNFADVRAKLSKYAYNPVRNNNNEENNNNNNNDFNNSKNNEKKKNNKNKDAINDISPINNKNNNDINNNDKIRGSGGGEDAKRQASQRGSMSQTVRQSQEKQLIFQARRHF